MNTQDNETAGGEMSHIQDSESSFEDFDLHPDVEHAILKMGFDKPTHVQTATFKKIMAGKDIIAKAQTGTGKTAAFGIPLVQRFSSKETGVAALALVPTRELALQVGREITAIGKKRGVRSASVYGGASFTKQVTEVNDGARIIVGTPGRVLDHIKSGSISFDNVKVLILDEADEMLSMGFEKEISEIIDSLPKKRQNLLFSATIPDDISRLTKRYMDEPTVISVSGDDIGAKEISHFVYLVSGQGRPRDMARILEVERPDSAIIFCNTRDETQTLAKYLKKSGYNADWLNSDLSQHEREIVMRRTRSGDIKFLVATDVAARGIDVSHLSHVINYTFPDSLESYIHRTGRTGRMGRRGTAISLITAQNIGNLYYLRLTYKIYPIEKTLADEDATEKTLEFDRMEALRKGLSKSSNEFQSLAKRVMQDVQAERIISSLLESRFSKQPEVEPKKEDKKEDNQKVKEEKPKTEAKTPSKAPPKKARPSKAPKEAKARPSKAPKEAEKPAEAKKKEPSKSKDVQVSREIFVDAGRKDGLRISFLMKEIMRLTNLERTALGKVRMLTRSAFVSVPEEHFTTVLKALGKIELDGKRLKAEPAEQS